MTSIKPTDLILRDGRVYHLGLHPDQLSDKVITVGDPDRVEIVSRHLEKREPEVRHREFVTHTGWFGGKRISVISTGMGTDNIEILMTELDALVNVDLDSLEPRSELRSLEIVRIGTSGSLLVSIPVDSLVVSAAAVGVDSLMCFYPFRMDAGDQAFSEALQDHLSLPFTPAVAYADAGLLMRVGEGMSRSITLTCPGFYAPQGRRVRLAPRQGDLLGLYRSFEHGGRVIGNFEMETAGYYTMGRLLGHRMLSVNVIVANRVQDVFSSRPGEAMDEAIERVLERI